MSRYVSSFPPLLPLFPCSTFNPVLSSTPLSSYRLLMLPLTCTVSMGCPPLDNRSQLTMATRSVHTHRHNFHMAPTISSSATWCVLTYGWIIFIFSPPHHPFSSLDSSVRSAISATIGFVKLNFDPQTQLPPSTKCRLGCSLAHFANGQLS